MYTVKLDCGEAFKVKPANACRVGRGSQSGQFGPTSSVVYSVLGALWRRAMSENQNAVAPSTAARPLPPDSIWVCVCSTQLDCSTC